MKYSEGDMVNMRVDNLLVLGTVKKRQNDDTYLVKFDWGTDTVAEDKLKLARPTRRQPARKAASPSRRSPSRRIAAQSPGRRQSPARTKASNPDRTKADPSRVKLSPSRANASPSRVKRSPSRVKTSPSRATTSPSRTKTDPSLAIASSLIKTDFLDLRVSVEKLLDVRSDSPSNMGFPRRRKPVEAASDLFAGVAPQESRTLLLPETIEIRDDDSEIPEMQESDRIMHLRQMNSLQNEIGKFSDDDEVVVTKWEPEREKRVSEPKTLSSHTEFGGWIGAFFLIPLIPTAVVMLHIFCNKNICSYTHLSSDMQEFTSLTTYVDPKALILYFGFLLISILISALPFGGRKVFSQPSKDKKYEYKMNGTFSAFMILGIVIALEYAGFNMVDDIIDKYFQMLISAVTFAAFLSVVLFVRSRFVPVSRLNKDAVTYNIIYDFFMGREVNPRILKIDVKLLLVRTSFIAVLIFNSVFLYKSLDVNLHNDDIWSFYKIVSEPILLTSCILQIFYALDKLIFEWTLPTTFELQYEGVGYMTVMLHLLYPFLLTTTSKFLYEHGAPTCLWELVAVCGLFFIGYFLYRASNSQKNAFRLNPYDPALAYLDSIPTAQGKKLLISSFWGRIRHPNYAGDMLMHLAFGALCIRNPAALSALAVIILLIHRTSRDGAKCKTRYGSAWERYCYKVKYRLIPKIY